MENNNFNIDIEYENIYSSYEEVKNNSILPEWFKKHLKTDIGKRYTDNLGHNGFLVGISETNEDYYYVLQKDNGKRLFLTCCSKLTELE